MAGLYSSCADALQALARGPGDFACHDYDTVREVVMCDAWHRLESSGGGAPMTFSEAIRDAWQQMRQACAPVGGVDHELNTPVELAEGQNIPQNIPPAVDQTFDILNAQSQPVGKLVVEATGSMTTCIDGSCHTDFTEPSAANREAILAAIRDIYPTVGYHITPEVTR